MSEPKDVQRRIESIEGLIREIERLPDPAAQSLAKQLVQSLMDLHGSGLERMLEIIHRCGEVGQQTIDELGRDDLVSSLLLLYGIHPLDLPTRVGQALEKTRPYLRSLGGDAELVSVSDAAVVTVRLEGSRHGCASSATTPQSAVEQAIYEAAPDAMAIIFEGAVQEPAIGFVPLSKLQVPGNGTGLHLLLAPPSNSKDPSAPDEISKGLLREQAASGRGSD